MSTPIQVHDLFFELLISEEKIQSRVQELGAELAEKFQDKNPLFVGILNGAFVFTADLVRACPIPSEVTFIKVSSYDGLTTTGKVNILLDFQESIENRHLILVEDIVDTGTTFHHLLAQLKDRQPASITIVSLLVKPEALKYPLSIDYKGFSIPNKFVIGYGLDYKEQARNLPAIYQLKK